MALSQMMQQYMDIKNQYKDFILFYRLGDFYEMFFDDAKLVSSELELTLTGRDCGEPERAPMCGVPYHASEEYIGRLIEKGYKVAVCEQMEDPKSAKGIVRRDVVRIITPGTVTDKQHLTDNQNNYLAMIYYDGDSAGICFADISTAYVAATSFTGGELLSNLENEISTYAPREILINTSFDLLPGLRSFIEERIGCLTDDGHPEYFVRHECIERAEEQFSLKESEENRYALIAAGAAVGYISAMQMTDISFLRELNLYKSGQFLDMDISTRRNLELRETMLTKERRGSLLWVLDHTSTSMGARLLRQFIEHPLTNVNQIMRRQGAVSELYGDFLMKRIFTSWKSPRQA